MNTQRSRIHPIFAFAAAIIFCACQGNLLAQENSGLDVKVQAVANPTYCEITVTATNRSEKTMVLDFQSAQHYDFYAKDSDLRIVWKWSNEVVFANAQTKLTLRPGEQISKAVKWKYVRNDGRRVKGGDFWIMGAITPQPQNKYSKPLQIEVPEAVSYDEHIGALHRRG